MFEEETYSRRAYNYLKKKWLLTTIISHLPSALLSILGIGRDVKWFDFLYGDEGYMKIGYSIVLVVVVLICIIGNCLWQWLNQEEEKSNEKLRNVYKRTKDMVRQYHSKCHKNFSEIIQKEKYKGSVKAALEAIYNDSSRLNPHTKIENILEHGNNLISYISGIPLEKISLVLVCKENISAEWKILVKRNIETGTDEITNLFKNQNSAFSQALRQRTWPVFFLRKSDAVLNNCYVPSEYELSNGLKGSIYCKDLSIYKKGKIEKGFILSVSSNDKQLAPNNTYGRNVLKETFELIEEMLKPELDHLYMSDYFNLGGFINEQNKNTNIFSGFERRRGGK